MSLREFNVRSLMFAALGCALSHPRKARQLARKAVRLADAQRNPALAYDARDLLGAL